MTLICIKLVPAELGTACYFNCPLNLLNTRHLLMFDLWDRNHFVDVVGMWHLSVFLRNADKWKKALLHNWHVVVLVNILHSRNSHRLLHRLNHRNLSLFLKWHRKNLDMLALDLGYCDRLLHHLGHVGNVILNNLSLPLNCLENLYLWYFNCPLSLLNKRHLLVFDLWDRNHFVDVVDLWHLGVFLRNADEWNIALLHNWRVVVLVNILHSRNPPRLLPRNWDHLVDALKLRCLNRLLKGLHEWKTSQLLGWHADNLVSILHLQHLNRFLHRLHHRFMSLLLNRHIKNETTR